MKKLLGIDILGNYSFNPINKTITFSNIVLSFEQILLIINVTNNITIYNSSLLDHGGTLVNNILTLNYNTTRMNNTDELQIFIWDSSDSSHGIPSGGIEGQALVKKSDSDYDTEWKTLINGDVYIEDSILSHTTKDIDTMDISNIGILQYLCYFISSENSKQCIINVKRNLINADYTVSNIIGDMQILVNIFTYNSTMILSITNNEEDGIIVNIVKKNLVFN